MKNCLVSILVLTAAFLLQSCNDVQKENKPSENFGDSTVVFTDVLPATTDSISMAIPSAIQVKALRHSASNAVYTFSEPSGKKMMSLYVGEHPLTLNIFGKILSSNKGELNVVGKKEVAMRPKSENKDVRIVHVISVGTEKSQLFLEFNYSQEYPHADILEKIISSVKFTPQHN